MSEQERLLRAEVLLLVSIAEASEDPFPKGLGTPHTMEAVGRLDRDFESPRRARLT